MEEKKKKIFEEAKETVSSKEKLRNLVSRSVEKLKVVGDTNELQELKNRIGTLTAMVRVHLSGQYRAFSTPSLLMVVFALIYFITPTDAIPDFIPAVGFTDDASVLYMIYRKLNKDIEAYLDWLASKKTD